jgi:hypothetical protein
VVEKVPDIRLYAMLETEYLQLAFSLVVKLILVFVVPAGRVPVGSPAERTGAVVSAGGGTDPTLIDTFCEVVPPAPEHDKVYVVLVVGETLCVPLVPLAPVQPFEAVHEDALVEDQVKDAD